VALGRLAPVSHLREAMPERLARSLVEAAGIDPALGAHALSRDARQALVRAVTAYPLPVTRDRGFRYAEVTAGGVPLREVRLETLESRLVPGLFLCGEILDVDGRLGGFNFQWAWSSGTVAGSGAVSPLPSSRRG
jgi:predicted flavoprotein YhiN